MFYTLVVIFPFRFTLRTGLSCTVLLFDIYPHEGNRACLDDPKLLSEINHPVHLVTRESGGLSPSAFIPFCEFGGQPDLLGERREEFNTRVCSSFRETLLRGQLCYQLDVNQYRQGGSFTEEQLRQADRQVIPLIICGAQERSDLSPGL